MNKTIASNEIELPAMRGSLERRLGSSYSKTPFEISEIAKDTWGQPTLAVLKNGNIVYSWATPVDEDDSLHLTFQLYNPKNSPINDPVIIAVHANAHNIVALQDGGFIVTYQRKSDETLYSIEAQKFSSSGEKVGQTVVLDANGGEQFRTGLDVFLNGDIVASWRGSDSLLYTNRYTPALHNTTPFLKVSDYVVGDTINHVNSHDVSVLNNQQVAYVWNGNGYKYGTSGYLQRSIWGAVLNNNLSLYGEYPFLIKESTSISSWIYPVVDAINATDFLVASFSSPSTSIIKQVTPVGVVTSIDYVNGRISDLVVRNDSQFETIYLERSSRSIKEGNIIRYDYNLLSQLYFNNGNQDGKAIVLNNRDSSSFPKLVYGEDSKFLVWAQSTQEDKKILGRQLPFDYSGQGTNGMNGFSETEIILISIASVLGAALILYLYSKLCPRTSLNETRFNTLSTPKTPIDSNEIEIPELVSTIDDEPEDTWKEELERTIRELELKLRSNIPHTKFEDISYDQLVEHDLLDTYYNLKEAKDSLSRI